MGIARYTYNALEQVVPTLSHPWTTAGSTVGQPQGDTDSRRGQNEMPVPANVRLQFGHPAAVVSGYLLH